MGACVSEPLPSPIIVAGHHSSPALPVTSASFHSLSHSKQNTSSLETHTRTQPTTHKHKHTHTHTPTAEGVQTSSKYTVTAVDKRSAAHARSRSHDEAEKVHHCNPPKPPLGLQLQPLHTNKATMTEQPLNYCNTAQHSSTHSYLQTSQDNTHSPPINPYSAGNSPLLSAYHHQPLPAAQFTSMPSSPPVTVIQETLPRALAPLPLTLPTATALARRNTSSTSSQSSITTTDADIDTQTPTTTHSHAKTTTSSSLPCILPVIRPLSTSKQVENERSGQKNSPPQQHHSSDLFPTAPHANFPFLPPSQTLLKSTSHPEPGKPTSKSVSPQADAELTSNTTPTAVASATYSTGKQGASHAANGGQQRQRPHSAGQQLPSSQHTSHTSTLSLSPQTSTSDSQQTPTRFPGLSKLANPQAKTSAPHENKEKSDHSQQAKSRSHSRSNSFSVDSDELEMNHMNESHLWDADQSLFEFENIQEEFSLQAYDLDPAGLYDDPTLFEHDGDNVLPSSLEEWGLPPIYASTHSLSRPHSLSLSRKTSITLDKHGPGSGSNTMLHSTFSTITKLDVNSLTNASPHDGPSSLSRATSQDLHLSHSLLTTTNNLSSNGTSSNSSNGASSNGTSSNDASLIDPAGPAALAACRDQSSIPHVAVFDEHKSIRTLINQWLNHPKMKKPIAHVLCPEFLDLAVETAHINDTDNDHGHGVQGEDRQSFNKLTLYCPACQHACSVELILSDLSSCTSIGTTLVEWIFQQTSFAQQSALIVLCSKESVQTSERLLRRGVFDLLSKPLNKAVLIAAVKRVLLLQKRLDFEESIRSRGDQYKTEFKRLRQVSKRPAALPTVPVINPSTGSQVHYTQKAVSLITLADSKTVKPEHSRFFLSSNSAFLSQLNTNSHSLTPSPRAPLSPKSPKDSASNNFGAPIPKPQRSSIQALQKCPSIELSREVSTHGVINAGLESVFSPTMPLTRLSDHPLSGHSRPSACPSASPQTHMSSVLASALPIHVLLVNDDAPECEELKQILSNNGVKLSIASSCTDALSIMKSAAALAQKTMVTQTPHQVEIPSFARMQLFKSSFDPCPSPLSRRATPSVPVTPTQINNMNNMQPFKFPEPFELDVQAAQHDSQMTPRQQRIYHQVQSTNTAEGNGDKQIHPSIPGTPVTSVVTSAFRPASFGVELLIIKQSLLVSQRNEKKARPNSRALIKCTTHPHQILELEGQSSQGQSQTQSQTQSQSLKNDIPSDHGAAAAFQAKLNCSNDSHDHGKVSTSTGSSRVAGNVSSSGSASTSSKSKVKSVAGIFSQLKATIPLLLLCDEDGPSTTALVLCKDADLSTLHRPFGGSQLKAKIALLLDAVKSNRQSALLLRRAMLYKDLIEEAAQPQHRKRQSNSYQC